MIATAGQVTAIQAGGRSGSRRILQLVDRDFRRKMNSKMIGDQTKEKPGRPAGRGVSTARRKEPDIAREKTRRRVVLKDLPARCPKIESKEMTRTVQRFGLSGEV